MTNVVNSKSKKEVKDNLASLELENVDNLTPIEQEINDRKVEKFMNSGESIEQMKLDETYTLIEANRRKAELDVKLKEADLEKKRLENEKKRGEALPTEFVVDLVKSVERD